MAKKLITENDIIAAAKNGVRVIAVEAETIITPSARDAAGRLQVTLATGNDEPMIKTNVDSVTMIPPPDKRNPNAGTVVGLGADHGGYQLKETLKKYILELGYTVADVGTHSEVTCDYPDFAYAVAALVASGQASRGIMIDAVGVASSIVANKVPGIRAVSASSEFAARSSREHNDANVLTLGGRVQGTEAAKSIVKVWLETWFGGGRHQHRVKKISDIEEKFLKRRS